MTSLLITNDDGIDAPALVPLAQALSRLGDVTVAAPSSERSWISKAISIKTDNPSASPKILIDEWSLCRQMLRTAIIR